jgi:flavin-dependent thymidylate synthase
MSKVQLVGHYGSDEQIALAAWTSTSRELTDDKIKRIPNMIETLYSEGHKTPFERGIVHFLVEADIASHIHLLKHRHMGTNGESARYKELLEDKMYLPEDWKGIWDNATQEPWLTTLEKFTKESNELYHRAIKDLTPILGRKRAKESARYFKTYNSVITTDCIMNMSCFANFYKLRHSDKAQKEISDIAEEMMILLENIEGNPFETTLKMIKS